MSLDSKPKTQRLRAFAWPDHKKPRKSRKAKDVNPLQTLEKQLERQARTAQEAQAIADYQAMFGDKWFPWAGPCSIFDVETLGVSRGQAMRFGVCHMRGLEYHEVVEIVASGRAPSQNEIDKLRRKILFYDPNDLEENAANIPGALEIVKSFYRKHKYELMTRTEFIRTIFLKRHIIKGDFNLPVLVIGHNLPFDLSALAVSYGLAEKDYYGGFSLGYGNSFLPAIQVRKIGAGKHLFGISGSTKDKTINTKLRFLDTVQLAHGLMGAQTSASMRDLCNTFDIHPRKEDVDYSGPITSEFITYACNDVKRTWLIYKRLRELFCKHFSSVHNEFGVATDIDKIYSEASLGKAYLKALGIVPFLEGNVKEAAVLKSHRDMMLTTCGIAMEAMHGARSEVRWRHEIREAMVADFKSEYPTLFVKLGLQELLIAERIDVAHGDAKGEIVNKLRRIEIGDLLSEDKKRQEALWKELVGYALVDPADGVWPVRTVYPDIDDDTPEGQLDDSGNEKKSAQGVVNIGVNHVKHGPLVWVSLIDILASKFMTGKFPIVHKTITLKPVGRQNNLRAIKFFGRDDYIIDLTSVNFFQRIIEMRAQIKEDIKKLKSEGGDIALLTAMELALKLIANSSCYGINVEVIVDDLKEERWVTVYHGDQNTREQARRQILQEDGTRIVSGFKVEKPGTWFNPFGPCITAGGRLLVTIAEALAKEHGLAVGMMDTDSCAFVRPDDMDREEFRRRVQLIAGKSGLFQNINPYEPVTDWETGRLKTDPVFAIEDINYGFNNHDKDDFKPLYILAISAKRYALANITKPDGAEYADISEFEEDALVSIRKATGHGLGSVSAPEYKAEELPEHSAAIQIKPDTTSPLWFGVKAVPVYGSLCKGRGNPRLFLDMWRIAFQQFIKHRQAVRDRRMTGGQVSQSIDNIIRKLPGLKAPQFQQRSLNTRTAWDIYKNLPRRRPFMFINVLPAPRLLPDHDGSDKQKFEASLLSKASLYTEGGYNPDIKAILNKGYGLWRRDNNENPHELMEEAGFILVSVSKNFNGYFHTRERKSKGLTGQLERRSLVILDHEYTGKETSYLLDQSTPEDDDTQIEDMATIPILRRGFNPVIMKELELDDVAAKCGITRETLLAILRGERKTATGVMKYIRSAFTYDEGTGHIEFEPQELSADKQLLRRIQFLVRKVYAKVQKECNDHNSKLARNLASGKISEDSADKTISWMDEFATRMSISEDDAYKLLRGEHIEYMIKKRKRQARKLLADLERVYGITEAREKVVQKVELMHSLEQRTKEFERRKNKRQPVRDKNLAQIVASFDGVHREVADWFTIECAEPYKGCISAIGLIISCFLAWLFFSHKDVQAVARKVMTIPERKADGVSVQFEKILFDRLTNGVERRREQIRRAVAKRRTAADKASEPIDAIVDNPLVK